MDIAECPDCPLCGFETTPFINYIPSDGDGVGYRCSSCDESWTVKEWNDNQ